MSCLSSLPIRLSNQSDRVTELNKQLVDTYLDIPYVETKCGYACSDQYVSLISLVPKLNRAVLQCILE